MLASAKAGLNFGLMAASFMCIADAAGVLFMLTPRRRGLKLHGIDTPKNNNILTINVIFITFTKNGGIYP